MKNKQIYGNTYANIGGNISTNTTIKTPSLGSYKSSIGGLTYTDYASLYGVESKPKFSQPIDVMTTLNHLENISSQFQVNIDWGKEIVYYTVDIYDNIVVVLRMWDTDPSKFLNLLVTSLEVMKKIKTLPITEELFDYTYTKKRVKEINEFYKNNYTLNYTQYIITLVDDANKNLMQEEVDKINQEYKSNKMMSYDVEEDSLPF